MIDTLRLARPYARAAFDYALEHQQLEHWATMLKTMAAWVAQPLVTNLLSNPQYTDVMRMDSCLALGRDTLDTHGENFIKLLAEHHRLSVLPAIYELFEHLRTTTEKTLRVTVKSAIELSESYRKQLHTALGKKLGQHIELHCEIDPALLGGILIKTGDRVIDNSVRGQLQRLQQAVITT